MTTRRGHVQGLDLLRGVAIGLVMLRHAWPEAFDGAGIVGVVMFFALSGYLITGVITRDIDKLGRIDYRRFYTNRALRLIPAMALMLTIFTVVELSIGPSGGVGRLLTGVAVGGLYLQDLLPFLSYPGINHLWTLAIEEQFYLVWPALMLLFARRKWMKMGLIFTIGIAISVCVLSVVLTDRLLNVQVIYPLPTTWAAALMIGGAAQIFRLKIAELLGRGSAWWAAGAATILAGFSILPDAKDLPITYLIGAPAIAICTVSLINHLNTWAVLPSKAFAPLRQLGVISYGAYLWNGPMTHWLVDVLGSPAWTTIPLTVAAATASWWMVERPALALKERLSSSAAAIDSKAVDAPNRPTGIMSE